MPNRFSSVAVFSLFALSLGLFQTGCGTTGSNIATGAGRPYDSVAYRPNNPNNVRVKVSLENRMVYVMEGDTPLLVTPTAIGRPGKETPTGNFRVTEKTKDRRSRTYGFWQRGDTIVPGTSRDRPSGSGWSYVGYPLFYWVQFWPAYGFHAGSVHPMPRTAGCLRLHDNVAPKFYELVKIGTPVHIARTQPEDRTIGANVPRPTDYANPDPHPSVIVSRDYFQRFYKDPTNLLVNRR